MFKTRKLLAGTYPHQIRADTTDRAHGRSFGKRGTVPYGALIGFRV